MDLVGKIEEGCNPAKVVQVLKSTQAFLVGDYIKHTDESFFVDNTNTWTNGAGALNNHPVFLNNGKKWNGAGDNDKLAMYFTTSKRHGRMYFFLTLK